MITFQKSISFDGDSDALPSVRVTLEVPQLTFEASDDLVIRQYSERTSSVTFDHATIEHAYVANLADDLLADDTLDTLLLANRYYANAFTTGDIESYVLPVAVTYRSLDGQLLGTDDLSVLAIPMFAPSDVDMTHGDLQPVAIQGFMLFDRARMLALRAKVDGQISDQLLLIAVALCTSVTDGIPTFNDAATETVPAFLESREVEPVAAANVVKTIKSVHSRLVDIALGIPAPALLNVAGILTITADDEPDITAEDFKDFEITAGWVDTASGRPVALTVGFTSQTAVTNDSAEFTVTNSVFRSAVGNDVDVSVQGIDNAPVWAESYRVDDPELANLAITVVRQNSGELTTLDVTPVDPNLRLRGRVVVLHLNCAVKDVAVFVQAKVTEDADWHVVGAAIADTAGNFSVPYPYGTFVAARAVCSVAPGAPVDIPIVAATGDRTIADDFLYVLAENTLTPDRPCEDEGCDCRDAKGPGRLPDFEDLIGSDVYSQDLGGGCINLSTPNRTINEHNFQAIVRMTDPNVATYRLARHELGLDEVDISQVASLVSGATELRQRATVAATAAQQDTSGDSLELLNASRTVQESAANAAGSLSSPGPGGFGQPPPFTADVMTSAKTDVSAVITTLETTRSKLVNSGGNLGPDAEKTLLAAYALKRLLDRGPLFFELNYGDQVKNAAIDLSNQAAVALTRVQVGAQSASQAGDTLKVAIQNITPHVQAVAAALAQGGPPVTLTALAKVDTQLIAITSVLQVAIAQLGRYRIAAPASVVAVVDAAQALRPLVDQAIDTAGSSVRYELTPATGTRTRQPVGLTNPVEWQRSPEPAAIEPVAGGRRFKAKGTGTAGRGVVAQPVPTSNPLEPAEAEFSQAVSVATGHILHYKVVFKADGYSLGDLVHSLPLAPGQKKQMVIFDASQRLLGAETQQLSQVERLAMGLVDERDITDTLTGNLSESLRGSSRANTSGISAGFGTAGQGSGSTGAYGGSGSAVLGVAGGFAQASSTAEQSSSRDVSQFFGEKLRQSIMQNAEGYRSLNGTVVTSVEQGQRFAVNSEVIANHNHCHSLTMMYFEVLRHYAIFQELATVEECVFVPLLLARFSVENIATWRDVLASALLPMPSETYLQPFVAMAGSVREHPLIKAFDAVQRLRTSYANVDMPAGAYDEEPIRFLKGSLQLRVNLPRPKTRYDRIKSLPVVNRVETPNPAKAIKSTTMEAILAGLTGGLSMAITGPPGTAAVEETRIVQAKQAVFDAFMSMDANFESVPPANSMRVKNFRPAGLTLFGQQITAAPDLFEDGLKDKEQWEQYAWILGYTDVLDMMEYYFRGRLISEWDEIFYNDIVPLVFDRLIDGIRLSEFATDVTALRRYNGGEQRITINISGRTNRTRSQLPDQLKLSVDSPHARALRSYVTFNVEDLSLTYSTAHYNGPLYAGSLGNDLLDGSELDIPERPDEKRNPRREDRYLAAALVEHLNSNLEHYNRVLWERLDPERRYMLLDGFAIQTYDDKGHPVSPQRGGLRSLASVVKNEVITVAGNSLVLPVAPGYRVNGALIRGIGPDGKPMQVTLLDHYKPRTPVKPYRVSVPTSGVYTEAVQGQCNACEMIETDRAQDWTRFTADEPTPINPITLSAPEPQDWQATWREFAQPMVNIQNAPGMPAPGAGLAGLSDALTTSGVFKDITGLDANQQNAMRTYLSNQENAKAFGEMAKEMAMQSHNTTNSGKIQGSIDSAQRSGRLTEPEAGQLTKDHIQQQIDGGASKKAETKANTPSLTKAAVDIADRFGAVKAFRSDSSGTEAIEAGQLVLTSGVRAPAQKTDVGGTVTQSPPSSSTGVLEKLEGYVSKLAKAALASKEDELQQALSDAVVKIAEEELENAVDVIPFGKALRLAVRYSTVFADAAGVVIEDSREEIQNIVDEAIKFSEDNGLTPEDIARLHRARSYMAIAMSKTVDALEAGLLSTVEAMLDDLAGVLGAAASDAMSQFTGNICGKLLAASKVDRTLLAVAQAVQDDVPAARLKVYQRLGTRLAQMAIASFTDGAARARLEALLAGATGDEPASVGVLRSFVEIGVSNLAHYVNPLDDLFPPNSMLDTTTLKALVQYEAKRAAKAVIDELKQSQWSFGSHNGYSGIAVDLANKHINLPTTVVFGELENGPTPPSGVLGLLEDDLATDEQALASVYDGLDVALMLKAAAYQADIDSVPQGAWEARLAAGKASCSQDAVTATVAARDAAMGLRSRYIGTPLQNDSVFALPVMGIEPATLRPPLSSVASMV